MERHETLLWVLLWLLACRLVGGKEGMAQLSLIREAVDIRLYETIYGPGSYIETWLWVEALMREQDYWLAERTDLTVEERWAGLRD